MRNLHVVIPNYCESLSTVESVNRLANQYNQETLRIYIVDSSPDDHWLNEISTFLHHMNNLILIKVDCRFFWSNSIIRGISEVLKNCNQDDYLMLLNNDVELSEGYITNVIDSIENNDSSCFSSGITHVKTKNKTAYEAGVLIDKYRLNIKSLFINQKNKLINEDYYMPDAISARALVIPITYFIKYSYYLNSFFLPHHWADLYLTALGRKRGFKLIVCTKAIITHKKPPSVESFKGNLFQILFSKKSPTRLVSVLYFWISALSKRI